MWKRRLRSYAHPHSNRLKVVKGGIPIGYHHAQMIQYHQGSLDLDRATYEIKKETRHYAKRQLKWFRKMHGANYLPVNPNDTAQSLADKLISLLPKLIACSLAVFLNFAQVSKATSADQNYAEAKKLFQRKEWGKANERLMTIKNLAPGSIEKKTHSIFTRSYSDGTR